jgi:GntR family galactonate operon transcriptional repressor
MGTAGERLQNLNAGAVKRSVRGDKLFLQVVHALAREIVRAGGERIIFPSEPELCQMFGVSRTVLREAVKVLEAKGLVEVGHGQGVKSRERSDWNHLDPDVLNWQCEFGADKKFLLDMNEIRLIFEPAAAALAASRGDDAAHARIKAYYSQMEEYVDNAEMFIQADLAFHREIIMACGNDILTGIALSVGIALRASENVSIQVPGWARSLQLHSALSDAITRRDPEAARAAMTVIIHGAIADIHVVLGTRSPSSSAAV